jgi:hypothetical protein
MPISPPGARTGCSIARSTCCIWTGWIYAGRRSRNAKRLLAELLAGAAERILLAEHLEGDGAQIQERAGAMGVIVETPASPPNL